MRSGDGGHEDGDGQCRASPSTTGSCSSSPAGLRDAGLDDAAETLEDAYYAERRVAALTIPDREGILRVLEDSPDEFAELARIVPSPLSSEGAGQPTGASVLRALHRPAVAPVVHSRVHSEKKRERPN
jgi:hypothetical protein